MKTSEHRLTLHHRKPISIGGARHSKRNQSKITQNKHRAWHTLFHNLTAQEICEEMNKFYLDPDYKMVCVENPQNHQPL
jgi:hypothetical protein